MYFIKTLSRTRQTTNIDRWMNSISSDFRCYLFIHAFMVAFTEKIKTVVLSLSYGTWTNEINSREVSFKFRCLRQKEYVSSWIKAKIRWQVRPTKSNVQCIFYYNPHPSQQSISITFKHSKVRLFSSHQQFDVNK